MKKIWSMFQQPPPSICSMSCLGTIWPLKFFNMQSAAQLQWLSLEVFTEVLQSAAALLVVFHDQWPPEVLPLLALKGLERLPGLCCLRWAHFVFEAAEQKEVSREPSAGCVWKTHRQHLSASLCPHVFTQLPLLRTGRSLEVDIVNVVLFLCMIC